MSIEAQAKEMAERIGWPYQHAGHIRCAGVDDMTRALIAFSDERNKELQSENARLREALSKIAKMDFPRSEFILQGPAILMKTARAALQPLT